MHLLSLTYSPPKLLSTNVNAFPYSVPTIQALRELKFTAPITFFVGENGSGKSTLMEAIAIAARSITVGSSSAETDDTLKAIRDLARHIRLAWHKRTHRGFFLRAEDYFGYAKHLSKLREEMEQEMKATDEEYARAGRSKYAAGLAKSAYARELIDMRERYGDGLDTRSHGESFLAFFQNRFVPGGLYLLDEPEAPLSPVRQLALLAALKQMVDQDAQFIIATHSPILMAFPEAVILNFDSASITPVAYNDLEHVTLTRSFLNNPNLYLKHL